MSMGSGLGPAWRNLRTDRSVVEQKLARETVRRVVGFARPHKKLIGIFLALTVVDASLVVVTPLLVKRIIDDGILKQNSTLVTVPARFRLNLQLEQAPITATAAIVAGHRQRIRRR